MLPPAPPAAASDSDAPSVLVQTTRLQRGSLGRIVTVYGTVQADAAARAIIASPLAAVVGQLYVRSGEAVAAGAALVLLQPSPPTRAAYAQATSALQVASASVRRTQQLLDQHLATRQQLSDAQKAETDAHAALRALDAQGAGGPSTLRAPFRAIVTDVPARALSLVTDGTALIELVRSNGLVLSAGAAPDQAAAITSGEHAAVQPLGGAAAAFATRVLSRGSVVDAGSGLVPVQIALPPGALLPGQSARADITVGTVTGYIIPHQAVLVDDDGSPYVVQAVAGLARIVHVRVLDERGGQDAIDGPLDAGAPLVLSGNYQAQDGMRVRLAQPAAPADRAPGH